MFSVTKYRFGFYLFSGLIIAVSLAGLMFWGLKFGLEFTGGSLLEAAYQEVRPPVAVVNEALKGFDFAFVVQPVNDKNLLLRFKEVDEAQHQAILGKLTSIFVDFKDNAELKTAVETVIPPADQAAFYEKTGGEVLTEQRFESIGPVIGRELRGKSITALILVLIAISLYISWAFRKATGFVSSWQYGAITLATLFHDVIITAGIFAFIGYFLNVEVGAPFIAAMLTVLGYSVNDTVVVFDRIRENTMKLAEKDFSKLVDLSLRQTFTRSFNTSLTVLITLLAIFLFGGESIKYFALTLLIGIGFGTYSSIFIASPLLYDTARRARKDR